MWSPTAPPRRLVERLLGLGGVADDVALDELHDEERALVDGLVGAQADGLGHRDARGPERGHEAVLAHHVVRRGQHVVDRGPAQDPRPPGGVLDPEGQVGAAAGDQGERQRGGDLGDVRREPLGHVVHMDAFRLV